MNKPTDAKRFPAWLRFVGWLAFSGLALVTVLVVARWGISKIGHQRAMKLVKHSQRFPHVPKHRRMAGEAVSSTRSESGARRGTPVAEVPLVSVMLPRDIATGQPYLYQRDANGGYKLWGTGIDGKSDGGNDDTDVIWTHRPVKTK